jgi:hypothetical protein
MPLDSGFSVRRRRPRRPSYAEFEDPATASVPAWVSPGPINWLPLKTNSICPRHFWPDIDHFEPEAEAAKLP